ncbi:16S rRNA (guanine(527)-N(7))-methyltransferase RsmG [bacterium]|nr:16S rRNA (guanine(527)-N(7))-methyltransferase RsmG [bacterium]
MNLGLKQEMSCGFKRLLPDIKESSIDAFELYYDELMKWQKKMNLTSLEGIELIRKLFHESMLFSKIVDMNKKMCILDVGSGSGIPGLPLKLVYNDIELHLLEKDKKKMNFLKNVVYKLSLQDVIFHNIRIEDFFIDGDFMDYYDIISSRALSLPDNVISDFKLLLKKKGLYIRKGCSDSVDIDTGSFKKFEVENPWDKSNPYIYYVYTQNHLQSLNDKEE